jgi:hypothetical protein
MTRASASENASAGCDSVVEGSDSVDSTRQPIPLFLLALVFQFRLEHELDSFAACHSLVDSEFSGLRGESDDLCFVEIFRLGKRIIGSSFCDGDCLSELGGCCEIIDSATYDPSLRQNGAILAFVPAVAQAQRRPMVEL